MRQPSYVSKSFRCTRLCVWSFKLSIKPSLFSGEVSAWRQPWGECPASIQMLAIVLGLKVDGSCMMNWLWSNMIFLWWYVVFLLRIFWEIAHMIFGGSTSCIKKLCHVLWMLSSHWWRNPQLSQFTTPYIPGCKPGPPNSRLKMVFLSSGSNLIKFIDKLVLLNL